MEICIDYQPAVSQCAGIGRYTRMLASEIAELLSDEDKLRLHYCDFRRNAKVDNIPNAEFVPFRLVPGAVLQRLWRRVGFPPYDALAGRADLFHFTNFITYPVRRGKSVVTIHDMSFERFPEFTEEKNLNNLKKGIRNTVHRADSIITISEFSRTEIEQIIPESKGKTHVTHLGISDYFRRASKEEIAGVKKELGIARPFIMTVGTVEPRKNLGFLVDVFEGLVDSGMDIDLVVSGARGWKCEAIFEKFANTKYHDRLHYMGFVPDGKLHALYSAADLFVTTSFYEGFGFPPLEAMACGTPVLSSAGGSLPEVLGDAATVVSSFDVKEWVHEAKRIFEDTLLKSGMVERGKKRAEQFRWSNTAKATLDIYRKTLNG